MLDKKEKKVLYILLSKCSHTGVSLVLAEDITKEVSKNFVISLANLDEIMISLNKDNYIDYVPATSKKGASYCISLKNKALTFVKDEKKQKKKIYLLLARTVSLAIVSFFATLILKAIFS